MKKVICGIGGFFVPVLIVLSVAILPNQTVAQAQHDSGTQIKKNVEKGSIKGGENRKGVISSNEYHVYTLQVDKAANVIIDHKQDSSNLDAFLVLQSEQGWMIQDDDDGGEGLNSRIMQKLNPGRYKILAGGLGSSNGSYMLTVNLVEPKQFTLGRTIDDKILNGEMKIYEFSLDKEGLVRIDSRRTEDSGFTPRLRLKLDSGNFIAHDTNTCNCPSSELVTYLNPGNYQVYLNGNNNMGGSYSLTMTRKEYKAQEHTSISYGEVRKGWIFPRQKHYYNFRVITGGHVQIDHMNDTSNLDAYLWLEDEKGQLLQSDDDGGIGLNSRIIRTLEPGSYKIIAGGLGDSSGKYELALRSIESKSIAMNGTVFDFIDSNSTKIYSFSIDKSMPVTFTCKRSGNASFAPYLDLMNEHGQFIAQDRNPGNLEQALLSAHLSPGAYQLFLHGYNNQGGQYVLSLKEGEGGGIGNIGDASKGNVEIGKWVSGTLNNQEKHVYNLSLKKETYVTIDQMKDNSNLDPYLMLNNDNGTPIQSNDDGGGDLNSRIMCNLNAGKYQVVAGTYGGSSGAYKLIVNEMKVQRIAVGQPVTDSIKANETKLYTLETKSDGLISIISRRVGNSGISPLMDLQQESGNIIGRDSNKGHEPASGISVYLPTGKYQLFIKGHNNTEGQFKLIVREEK